MQIYRKLNAATVKKIYPLPRIADSLSRLEGSTFFSIMDVQQGYYQIPLREEDRKKSAFGTADGLYEFKVMPFGLTNAPATFQKAMDLILAGLRWTTCLVYLDDVILYAKSFSQHTERLDHVLACFKKAGLKLKLKKCHFCETSLKVLGHIVNVYGIGPDPEKLEAISQFPSPNEGKNQADKVKRTQSFLGICSYYRRHIFQFSIMAQPLTALTKKDSQFNWGPEQQQSFEDLKNALTHAPVLMHPRYDLPMEVIPDACGYGIGGVLAQTIEGIEHPIAYASRLLSGSELNYSITEKECLGLVWCLTKFRNFIWGTTVKVITDHQSLCWLMTKRDLAGRLARWSLSLQEYDIQIFYRSGKLHDNADCLSRNPLEKEPEEKIDDRCLIVAALQMETQHSFDFVKQQKKFPAWKTRMEALRNGRKVKGNFCLKNDRLYIKTFKNGNSYLRLCVPKKFRDDILKAFHDDVVSGHMGIKRTLEKIRKRYYWPKMGDQIYRYVRACESCQGRKSVPDKPAGFLQCIKVEQPFEKIGIDYLGPFPISNSGNTMILAAVDYLTKWVEARATPTGKADVVADFLVNQILLRHGAPKQIISDRGKCFLAKVSQHMMKMMESNHKTTSSYHPQGNGLIERTNHTFASMLSMYVSGDHKDWDETLQYLVFAYNTARQESMGVSPFENLYGRQAIIPIDLQLGADPNQLATEEEASMDYADRVKKRLNEARQIVKTRMNKAQNKQKLAYDAKHRGLEFKAGDLVLIYKPFRKVGKSEKLLHRWLGPFRVIRKTTPVNYEIQAASGKGKTDIVHVVKMKPFYQSIVENEEEEDEDDDVDFDEDNNDMDKEIPEEITETIEQIETAHEPSIETEEIPTPEPEEEAVAAPQEKTALEEEVPPSGPRRSKRTGRKQPARYVKFLLPFNFCFMLMFQLAASVAVRENALFYERPGVAFSESSWTVITDLDLSPASEVCLYLREKIDGQYRELERYTESIKNGKANYLQPQILTVGKIRTEAFELQLNDSCKRLEMFQEILGDEPRNRRGLIDGGGIALKWLFGLSTEKDLEAISGQVDGLTSRQEKIVHLLDQQATVVNETLWEIKTTTKLMAKLKLQYIRLDEITAKTQSRLFQWENDFQYLIRQDTTFDAINMVMNWLYLLVNDLDVGLNVLANGKLPPQIFPPKELKPVLDGINLQLPPGWKMTTDLWLNYREGKVTIAAINNRFRIFFKIPIYERAQSFTVYIIINIPKATKNGTHGIIYANLPDYLAITPDLEAFVELNEDQMEQCTKTDQPICKFHTGISRKN